MTEQRGAVQLNAPFSLERLWVDDIKILSFLRAAAKIQLSSHIHPT